MAIQTRKKVVNSSGLRKTVYTQNNTVAISNKKGKIRRDIEAKISEESYDIYDMVADMSNALVDLLEGKKESKAITKFKSRQTLIKNIISRHSK